MRRWFEERPPPVMPVPKPRSDVSIFVRPTVTASAPLVSLGRAAGAGASDADKCGAAAIAPAAKEERTKNSRREIAGMPKTPGRSGIYVDCRQRTGFIVSSGRGERQLSTTKRGKD
jgi:hypothetical protein